MPKHYLQQKILQFSDALSALLTDPIVMSQPFGSAGAQHTLDSITTQLIENFPDATDRTECICHLSAKAAKNLLKLVQQKLILQNQSQLTVEIFREMFNIPQPQNCDSISRSSVKDQKRSASDQRLVELIDNFVTVDKLLQNCIHFPQELQEMIGTLINEQANFDISNIEKFSEEGLNKIANRAILFEQHLPKIKEFFQDTGAENGYIYLLLLDSEYFLSFIKNFFEAKELYKTFEFSLRGLNQYPLSEILKNSSPDDQAKIKENLIALANQDNFRDALEIKPSMNMLIGKALSDQSLKSANREQIFSEITNQIKSEAGPRGRLRYLLTASPENLQRLCRYFPCKSNLLRSFGLAETNLQQLENTLVNGISEQIKTIRYKHNYLDLLSYREYTLKPFENFENTENIFTTLADNLKTIDPVNHPEHVKLTYLCWVIPNEAREAIINVIKNSGTETFLKKCAINITSEFLTNWIANHPSSFLAKLSKNPEPASPVGAVDAVISVVPSSDNKDGIPEIIANALQPEIFSEASQQKANTALVSHPLIENLNISGNPGELVLNPDSIRNLAFLEDLQKDIPFKPFSEEELRGLCRNGFFSGAEPLQGRSSINPLLPVDPLQNLAINKEVAEHDLLSKTQNDKEKDGINGLPTKKIKP
ncbi:MAG: hypothetical protein H2069_03365 [Legionella sp.]|nr:hypothetical protein [Legionella sp.]